MQGPLSQHRWAVDLNCVDHQHHHHHHHHHHKIQTGCRLFLSCPVVWPFMWAPRAPLSEPSEEDMGHGEHAGPAMRRRERRTPQGVRGRTGPGRSTLRTVRPSSGRLLPSMPTLLHKRTSREPSRRSMILSTSWSIPSRQPFRNLWKGS